MSATLQWLKDGYIKEYGLEGVREEALKGWSDYAEKNSFRDAWELSKGMRLYFYGLSIGLRMTHSEYVSLP